MQQVTPSHWQTTQERLKSELGDVVFESWLQPLDIDLEKTTPQEVTLKAPTRFIRDWVLRHYSEELRRTLTDTLGTQGTNIHFDVTPPQSSPTPNLAPNSTPKAATEHTTQAPQNGQITTQSNIHLTNTQTFTPTTQGAKTPQVPQSAAQQNLLDATNALDARFTFERFVTGKANEFAFAAAKRIAESPEAVYNPFLLYGGVGLGKTHLMHAIAWHITQTQPQRRVLYISSEKFVYQFIRSLRDNKTTDFKQAFRSVDVLMIDDIQFIAGKDRTQEEFFHTLNALIDMQKQVILSADKSPHEMDNLEDRLRSRLGWGLTTEMHKPDLETRLAILDAKAHTMGVELPKDVAMVLADKISTNVRELEGALNRLIAHADLVGCEITLATAQTLLKDIFQASAKLITIDEIQMKVADYYRIKLHEMHTARRSRDVARPRQIAMYLSKRLTSRSFPEIGKNFGGRDHTTVMHAVRTIEKLSSSDKTIAEDLHTLENMLV